MYSIYSIYALYIIVTLHIYIYIMVYRLEAIFYSNCQKKKYTTAQISQITEYLIIHNRRTEYAHINDYNSLQYVARVNIEYILFYSYAFICCRISYI